MNFVKVEPTGFIQILTDYIHAKNELGKIRAEENAAKEKAALEEICKGQNRIQNLEAQLKVAASSLQAYADIEGEVQHVGPGSNGELKVQIKDSAVAALGCIDASYGGTAGAL